MDETICSNWKNKKNKRKTKLKSFPEMMVGHAPNHDPGTCKFYKPKTNRVIQSQDVQWLDFKGKKLNRKCVIRNRQS